MANTFHPFNPDGGNIGVWASPEHEILRLGLGACTPLLYLDGADLKLSQGRIGLDDGSQEGAVEIDTVTTLSVAALTVSLWARVEVSRTYTTPAITLTSIVGASDPAALPAGFTGAYDGAKQGYYVTATKRVIGLVWINAAGAVEGIVNVGAGSDYAGYATSNDAYDVLYYFLSPKYVIPQTVEVNITTQTAVFTAGITARVNHELVTTGASSFLANIPAQATWKGRRIRIEKVDTGAGAVTVTPNGAETLGTVGATAFPLRRQGDYIELMSAGTMIIVLDSLSTLVSAALNGATPIVTAHGLGVQPRTCDWSIRCTSADANYAAGEEIVFNPSFQAAAGNDRFIAIKKDATNIVWLNDDSGGNFWILDAVTGLKVGATSANWIARYRLKI